MCYFITLVVQGADEASIASVLARQGRRAMPIGNPSVASVLRPGEVQFLTTVGHCDCATALIGRSTDRSTGRRAREVERLAKKGWSPSKIERWLQDRETADVRAHARANARSTDSIALWTSLVDDLFAMRGVRQAGLLLHNYSGDVRTEAFEATRASTRLDDFAARLPKIQDGELLMAERS
jgi:hypothetical protein